jgi:serine/arginine repetitive matrix protein 2
MIRAQWWILEQQSLEDSVLIADGEDLSGSCKFAFLFVHPMEPDLIFLLVCFMPVFSCPGPAGGHSWSSTVTTSSSGGDTPPLSLSDGFFDGSQSSINLSQLNVMLLNATHPMMTAAHTRAHARACGHGHHRCISQACASRSSVYETIEEENSHA